MLLCIWTRFSNSYDFALIWTRKGVFRVSLSSLLEVWEHMNLLDDHTIPRWPQPTTTIVTILLPSLRESFTLAGLRNKYFVLLMMAVMAQKGKLALCLVLYHVSTNKSRNKQISQPIVHFLSPSVKNLSTVPHAQFPRSIHQTIQLPYC